jgi:signal transduction histidine kinase
MLTARVFRTGRPARIDGDGASFQHRRRELGIGSAAGAPIRVDGRLWGAMVVAAARPARLPEGIEARIAAFTELVATTLSNLQARAELAASRKRIAEAADAERRRVVRDLHDGAQSRLVHAVIALERLRSREDLPADAQALVADGLLHARSTIHELRELVHGIRPAILTNGGLADAIGVLAQRTPLALDVTIGRERFPGAVESAAYLVVAEALTNVAKHARARRAWVTVAVADDSLVVEVRDDGVGGAADVGPGLVGMHDRVAALDGRLVVTSPPGGGTIVSATIPLRRAPATLPDQTPVVRNRSR